jgi:hypothetical protein
MFSRKIALAAASALPVIALCLLWLWQPERQVRLHTTHFLKKVEDRNWDKAALFIAGHYTDRWGHDKAFVVRESREVFRQFLFLTIENKTLACDLQGNSATTRTVVKITGSGGPLAQLVMERVNTLREPFVFEWRQQSGKPWDWQLTRIDQPELSLDAAGAF